MIHKEAAIAVLEKYENNIRTDLFFDSTPTNLIRLIKNSINSLPDDDGWISVEKRLPESSGKYLCCAVGMYTNSWEAFFKKCTGFWNGESGRCLQDYVTHWCPLPKPPIINE